MLWGQATYFPFEKRLFDILNCLSIAYLDTNRAYA